MIKERQLPIYPIEAKKSGISGTVTMKAVIGADGLIVDLEVVSGPPELRQAAIEAARDWQYYPFHINGEPLEVQTTISIAFKPKK